MTNEIAIPINSRIDRTVRKNCNSLSKSLAVFFLCCYFLLIFTNKDKFLGIADYYVFLILYVVCCSIHILESKYTRIKGAAKFIAVMILLLIALFTALMYRSISTGYIYSYALYVIAFMVTVNCGFNKRDLKVMIGAYIWSAVIISLIVIIKPFDYYRGSGSRMTIKFMSNNAIDPNFLAAYLLFPCLLCIVKLFDKFTLMNAAKAALTICGILLTTSRGAMISLFIGILFILFYYLKHSNKQKRLLLIVCVAIAVVVILLIMPKNTLKRLFFESYVDGSNSKRVLNWLTGLRVFCESPIFGYGLQNENIIVQRVTGVELVSHNTYIALLLQFGIVGCVVLLPLLFCLLKYVKKNIILIGLLAANFAVCFLISAETAIFFWWPLIFVVLMAQSDKKYHKRNSWLRR